MNGRGWARKVEEPICFDIIGFNDIVLFERKLGVAFQVRQVISRAGQEVIHADDRIAFFQKPVAQMAA